MVQLLKCLQSQHPRGQDRRVLSSKSIRLKNQKHLKTNNKKQGSMKQGKIWTVYSLRIQGKKVFQKGAILEAADPRRM